MPNSRSPLSRFSLLIGTSFHVLDFSVLTGPNLCLILLIDGDLFPVMAFKSLSVFAVMIRVGD
jgi:hypothetical protein